MGSRQSSEGAFADVLPATKKQALSATKTSDVSKGPIDNGASATTHPPSQAEEVPTVPGEAHAQIVLSSASMQIQPPAHALLQDQLAVTREENEAADRLQIPESVRKSRLLDEFAAVCSEILPEFLFVSNVAVARDTKRLRALGITHAVNCCKELCIKSLFQPDGDVDDAVSRSTLRVFELALRDDVVTFIDDARRSGASKVLIHCHQGISRSCAFAVAYVMYQQQQQSRHAQHKPLGFREALAFELAPFSALSPDAPPRNVLYRLAPHAAHDPETLVLKVCRCVSASQQSPVVVTYDAGSWRPIVWSRGIFVFMGSPQEVTIWKGCACDIANGAAEARRHAERMVRVRVSCLSRGDANDQENATVSQSISIADIDEASENGNAAQDCDRFGYADELAWMQTGHPGPVSMSSGNDLDGAIHHHEAELAALEVPGEKPLLFVLDSIDGDGDGSWDQLTEYDSEDLTSGDAFLLYAPAPASGPASDPHYLWIGSACAVAEGSLMTLAMQQVMKIQGRASAKPTAAPVIERARDESEQFWSAFERGY